MMKWCPAHPHETATKCLGCASDHKAGEHNEDPSAACRYCRARARAQTPRYQQPTLDAALLAAHDDTLADVIPIRSRRS